jgi:hypothetical protein
VDDAELDCNRSAYVGVLATLVEREIRMATVDAEDASERVARGDMTVDEAFDLGIGTVSLDDFEDIRNSAMEDLNPDIAAPFLDITREEAVRCVAERWAEQRRRGRAWRDGRADSASG